MICKVISSWHEWTFCLIFHNLSHYFSSSQHNIFNFLSKFYEKSLFWSDKEHFKCNKKFSYSIAENHEHRKTLTRTKKTWLWRLYWITHNNKNITFYNLFFVFLSHSFSFRSLFYETLARHKAKHNSIFAFISPTILRAMRKQRRTKTNERNVKNYIERYLAIIYRRRILKGNF